MADQQCPRCGRLYTPYEDDYHDIPYPALSRRDNKTHICSSCGEREAFEDMGWETYSGLKYWQDTEMYRVAWEIEVQADSAVEAARLAQIIMRDSDSIATVFRVDGHNIDLAEVEDGIDA